MSLNMSAKQQAGYGFRILPVACAEIGEKQTENIFGRYTFLPEYYIIGKTLQERQNRGAGSARFALEVIDESDSGIDRHADT